MVALATFLAAFPVVLSALNLAVPRNAISFGFSGINMAFAGLLPLLLGVYARERFFPEASIRALPAVFFPLVGWMAFLALPVSPGVSTNPDSLDSRPRLRGSCSVCCTRRAPGSGSDGRSGDGVRAAVSNPATATCFAIGVALVVGYPVVGFPGDPTGPDSVVNLYVHLLGFCLAFIGPFILLAAGTFEE